MGIRFACHACGKRLNIKSELAGRRGVCPACSQRFRIPAQDAATSRPIDRKSSGGQPHSQPAVTDGAAPSGDTRGTASRSTGGSDFQWGNAETTWYVRPSTGGQFGPADGPTMQQWFREGRVAGDTLLWRDGWTDWRHAESLRVPQPPTPRAVEPAATLPPAAPDADLSPDSSRLDGIVPLDAKADRKRTLRGSRGKVVNFVLILIAAGALGTLTFVLISA